MMKLPNLTPPVRLRPPKGAEAHLPEPKTDPKATFAGCLAQAEQKARPEPPKAKDARRKEEARKSEDPKAEAAPRTAPPEAREAENTTPSAEAAPAPKEQASAPTVPPSAIQTTPLPAEPVLPTLAVPEMPTGLAPSPLPILPAQEALPAAPAPSTAVSADKAPTPGQFEKMVAAPIITSETPAPMPVQVRFHFSKEAEAPKTPTAQVPTQTRWVEPRPDMEVPVPLKATFQATVPLGENLAVKASPDKAVLAPEAPLPEPPPVATPVWTATASAPATPAAAARSPLPTPAAALAQVEGGVRWMLKHQANSADLVLHPASLGRVSIRLRVEGNEVHARVWATEPTTVPLLQQQREVLESSLRQQGLSLGSFDLHQGQRGQDAQQAVPLPSANSGAIFAESLAEQQEMPTWQPVVLEGHRLIEGFA